MTNNAQATATYTNAGLGAPDTNAHILDFQLIDSSAKISWSFDGVAQADITNVNNVPPSTTAISPLFILEAQSATNLAIYERWSSISQDVA